MINKIEKLQNFVLLEEKSITNESTQSVIKKAKTKVQRKEILAKQRSVMKNALKLYDKRTDM